MTKQKSDTGVGSYRSDIDGLRAIAIISVIGFHAFPAYFEGGFVGVDIFFVISGYLISSQIIKEINNSEFQLFDFYRRRVQRLFPALILVLLAVLAYTFFLKLNDEFISINQSIAASSIFIANYFFWGLGGYFDSSADVKPLLHVWSLSIEEQFYLFWPIFLIVALNIKKIRVNFQLVALSIFVVSFVFSVYESYVDPFASFFSILSRVWEFGVGACLSQNVHSVQCVSTLGRKKTGNWQALTGIILIAMAIIFLKPSMPFPGWAALIPVLGTALIINAGPDAVLNKRFLSSSICVWIGLISYPLYLWHWPLLVFSRLELSMPPPEWLRCILIFIALILAWLTYKFVEKPFRRTKASSKKTLLLIACMLVIASLSYYYSHQALKPTVSMKTERQQFEDYYLKNLQTRSLSLFEEKFRHDCNFYQVDKYYAGETTQIPKSSISPSCYVKANPTDKSVLIWGDSHAQMLNYGLSKTLPSDWSILQVASSGCYPNTDYDRDSETNYCVRSNWFAMELIRSQQVDVVILAQSTGHNSSQLNYMARRLQKIGVKRVIIMGPAPRWTELLPKIVLKHLWESRPDRTTLGVDTAVQAINIKLGRELNRSDTLIFADTIGVFCNLKGCLTEIGQDDAYNLTTWDLGHFTQAASKYLAEKLLANLVTGKTW